MNSSIPDVVVGSQGEKCRLKYVMQTFRRLIKIVGVKDQTLIRHT